MTYEWYERVKLGEYIPIKEYDGITATYRNGMVLQNSASYKVTTLWGAKETLTTTTYRDISGMYRLGFFIPIRVFNSAISILVDINSMLIQDVE